MKKPRIFKRKGRWMARMDDRLVVGLNPVHIYNLIIQKTKVADAKNRELEN